MHVLSIIGLLGRRGNPLIFGLVVGGLLMWEVVLERNARRWPVWCLLVPTIIYTYVGGMMLSGQDLLGDPPDPSWWVAACWLVAPFSCLPYAFFRAHERMDGR